MKGLVDKFTRCRNCGKGHTVTFGPKDKTKDVTCVHCGTHNTQNRPKKK